MGRFLIGVVVGAVLAGAAVAGAHEISPQGPMQKNLFGDFFIMEGWSISVDGRRACNRPQVWPAYREIQC